MSEQQNRRPGPIGFHAESKVTTQSYGAARNAGGIGESSLTRETLTRSKELRRMNNGWLALVGLVIALVGMVLLSPLVIIIGVAAALAGLLANRTNRTETRLRSRWEQGGAGQ